MVREYCRDTKRCALDAFRTIAIYILIVAITGFILNGMDWVTRWRLLRKVSFKVVSTYRTLNFLSISYEVVNPLPGNTLLIPFFKSKYNYLFVRDEAMHYAYHRDSQLAVRIPANTEMHAFQLVLMPTSRLWRLYEDTDTNFGDRNIGRELPIYMKPVTDFVDVPATVS